MGASEILAVDISDRQDCHGQGGRSDAGRTDSPSTSRYGRFDVVIEAAGNTPAFNAAVQLVGPGGHAVFIGIPTCGSVRFDENFRALPSTGDQPSRLLELVLGAFPG